MDEAALIRAVREHALANYNEGGWDYVVESYEDGDILEDIGDAATVEEAIARVAKMVGILDEHRKEIRATAEW